MTSLSKPFWRPKLTLLVIWIFLFGAGGLVLPVQGVIPIEDETAVTRSLQQLGVMIAKLGRTNMLPIVTSIRPPLAPTCFPDAPDLIALMESALNPVRAGVRYVPVELLAGVAQSNQTPVLFLKPALTAYDKGITNTENAVGISLLFEAWSKFLSAEGQVELAKDFTRLAFSVAVIGPDGILMPERGASLQALLCRERRGRRAFLVFNGSGGNLIQSVVRLDGAHSALRVLSERAVAQVLARLLEIDLCKCSGIDQFDERLPRFWRESFNGFDTLRRVLHVQVLLRANGYQYVEVTGVMDEPTTAAIEIFRMRRNLPSRNERLDAELFVELNMALPPPAAEITAVDQQTIRVQFIGAHAGKAISSLMSLWSSPGLGLIEVREFTPKPWFGARALKLLTLGGPKAPKHPEFTLRLTGEAELWRIEQAIRESASALNPQFKWKNAKGTELLLVRCE